ncbi:autotransporter outer membrane beta-barrel domain-containing protein [Methylocaldum sp.]|uniref:autotransporter outer membrane beta-barrel domain-containing protein n=1 Tax=Methylocaldum sp. TaxID=1969727 RepID=UPI002D347DDC|nr:autotransporter outer membrane beta-barrel domain-containing protein [Methylocaldum sp.]HYE34291.1 autotransporter outer membrane beta-barrel domain-containing protein [Methylocaldum sp.]
MGIVTRNGRLRSATPFGISLARIAPVLCAVGSSPLMAASTLFSPATLNETQTGMSDVILEACSERNPLLSVDFRDRCDAVVGAAVSALDSQNPSASFQPVENVLQIVSPEQILHQGTAATRVTAGQVALVDSTIGARLATLHAGLGLASLQTYRNGSLPDRAYAGLGNSFSTGGAAGDDSFSPLSVWIDGNYHFGDVDSTFDQKGFQFKNFGFTGGADYRFTDNFVAGLAFTYARVNANFDRSAGGTDSDAYTGSIYGSFYLTEGFHIDAIGSFGGIDYETTRNISYTLPGFETINTQAVANPGGSQYSFSIGGGYDYSIGGLTLAPYARTEYIGLDVDSYRERQGNGWGMRFDEQHVQSLISTVGSQISYAFGLPWGVVTPQLRGEWHHQFKDDKRTIGASFLGDPAAQQFAVVTQGPDRDYYTFGAEVSGVFSHGISAFLAYDLLLGYRDVESHKFTLGTRLEF